VLILDELIAARGERANRLRFQLLPQLLPQLVTFVVYEQFWLLRLLNPVCSYSLNADIEAHAEREHARLVADHPEWDAPASHPSRPEYGSYESLADVFARSGPTGVHQQLSLERIARSR